MIYFLFSVPSQRSNHPLPPQTPSGWPCDPGRRTGLYHPRQLRRSRPYRRKQFSNFPPSAPRPSAGRRRACGSSLYASARASQEWTLAGSSTARASLARRKLIVLVLPPPLHYIIIVICHYLLWSIAVMPFVSYCQCFHCFIQPFFSRINYCSYVHK